MMDDSPFGHVHCRACGREMRPEALICPRCDAIVTGRGPAVAPYHAPSSPQQAGPRAPAPPPEAVTTEVPADWAPSAIRAAATVATARVSPPFEYALEPAAPVSEVAAPAMDPPAAPVRAATKEPSRRAVVTRRRFRPIDLWRRYLPPVRLVWLFLGILVAVGGGFVSGLRAYPLLAIPVVGAITDLAFQKVRFPKLRFPDAALATSLFLSVIIWPAELTLPLLSIVVVSIGLRHFVRAGGHPWFNPAAAGLVLATALFALPSSWHVGLNWTEIALVALFGVVLMVRAPHAWRIPVFYFGTYLLVVLGLTFALGAGARWPLAIEFEVLSGASVFFGFFMVTEPRTAPSARWAMAVYGSLLGVVSAGFPVLFTEVPALGALGVIAPFLALLVGNFFTLVLPSARGAQRRPASVGTASPG